MVARRITYRVLVGKPEGKSPLERLRRRCEDNIKIYIKGMGLQSMDWIDLARDRENRRTVLNEVMKLRVR